MRWMASLVGVPLQRIDRVTHAIFFFLGLLFRKKPGCVLRDPLITIPMPQPPGAFLDRGSRSPLIKIKKQHYGR